MATEALDPIELLARLDPIPPAQLDELAHGPERERTFARICAHRDALPARTPRMPRRRLAAAVVVAVALAVPALAFSGDLGSLFGFSNQGTPVPQADLSQVSAALALTGATPGSVVRLASRDGWTFLAAKTPGGDVCYFDESAAQSQSNGIPNVAGGGGCKNAAGKGDFPSPALPVFNMSHYFGGRSDMSIVTLAGVAADGVASVQVLALSDCRAVATAPVVDNVYVADNLPTVPEAQIVARDASGDVVWHQAVTAGVEPGPPATSCGLG